MIDKKIKQLRKITSNFLYVEYYSRKKTDCWKINNEFTTYDRDKLVLCKFNKGIEKALDLAIKHITKLKSKFNNP